MPNLDDWQFPELNVGDHVVFSIGSVLNNPQPAIVAQVDSRTCDLLVIGGGQYRPMFACRHADDPLVPMNPLWFDGNENCGVFRLTESEKRVREALDSFNAQRQVIAELSTVVGKLMAKVDELRIRAGDLAPPKKGPKGPWKHKPTDFPDYPPAKPTAPNQP